jgi:CDP-4-dehydro-6-deoxyglucose reductase, E3
MSTPILSTRYTVTVMATTQPLAATGGIAPAPKMQFSCGDDQAVLDAALQADLVLPYGCKNGACGTCKTPLNSGTVTHRYDNSTVRAAQAEGAALLCCAHPSSDITITARVQAVDNDYPLKKLPARIASISKAAPDVAIVKLQLPAAEKLAFRAGQYVEFILRDGSRRAYSIANAPHSLAQPNPHNLANPSAPTNQLELHIRHMPGGVFTDALFGVEGSTLPAMKEKDIARIEVPHGTFYLRDPDEADPHQTMIMLASGTGFAPIKAIIEHSLFLGSTRPICLYWGGRQLVDLYAHELALSWARQHNHITYIPVLSEANTASTTPWQGRTGFVHQAVMHDHADMSTYQVYACGAPIVVTSAQRDFVARCQLPQTAFFADSFTSAADAAA